MELRKVEDLLNGVGGVGVMGDFVCGSSIVIGTGEGSN